MSIELQTKFKLLIMCRLGMGFRDYMKNVHILTNVAEGPLKNARRYDVC